MALDEWGIPITKKEVIDNTPVKPKKKDAFKIINSCFKKDFVATPEEAASVQEYLFTVILSNHPGTINIADFINTSNIPADQVYNYVNKCIPPGAIKYIPYPKKSKSEDNESIDNICKFYKCSIDIGNRYAELLPQEEIDKINDIYREGGLQKKGK